MKEIINSGGTLQAGEHLKGLVRSASFGGLFLSLSGTAFAWAGTESFHCSELIWKFSLMFNLFLFILTWTVYLPFRKTDRLIGNGLLAIPILISIFWIFGFSGFYFYFLFAPIDLWLRTAALTSVTAMLLHRAHIIVRDIKEAFQKHKNLFKQMYIDEGTFITFRREAINALQKSRRDRNPFKSYHLYVAIFLSPFVFTVNRLMTPLVGDGHGVFMVLAFFSVPMLLWEVELFVQTVVTMIYYPIKLERETGKPVLLKDW